MKKQVAVAEAMATGGGGSGIRTHVRRLAEAVFETAALGHYAIPPQKQKTKNFEQRTNDGYVYKTSKLIVLSCPVYGTEYTREDSNFRPVAVATALSN